MAKTSVRIPSDQVRWFRSQVKSTINADADTNGLGGRDDPDRELALEVSAKLAACIDILDQLGWFDADAVSGDLEADIRTLRDVARESIEGLGERMKEACGDYSETKLDLDEIDNLSNRALWLTRFYEALSSEAVAA